MTVSDVRPGVVTGAVWALLIGGVMLAAGGLTTAAVSFDTLRQVASASVPDESIRASLWLYRGVGILFTAAAAALILLAVRAGRREIRFRRATVALGMTVILVVVLISAVVGTHILALLSLVPIVVGTWLLSRPAAVQWYLGSGGIGAGGTEPDQ